jgi:hypothetical protein
MKRTLLTLLAVSLGCGAFAQQLAMPPSAVPLTTTEGENLLLTSHERADYWLLTAHPETQVNNAFCGIASSCMVLNSLNLAAPLSPTHPPFHAFEQDNVFTPETEKVLPKELVMHRGATLDQLGGFLSAEGTTVSVHHAGDSSVAEFRALASKAVGSGTSFAVVNFRREPLGQQSGGHFSPLAAYNQKADRFLVMDVARFHYPPWWIPTADLFKAMDTVDSDSKKTRGFLIVSKQR